MEHLRHFLPAQPSCPAGQEPGIGLSQGELCEFEVLPQRPRHVLDPYTAGRAVHPPRCIHQKHLDAPQRHKLKAPCRNRTRRVRADRTPAQSDSMPNRPADHWRARQPPPPAREPRRCPPSAPSHTHRTRRVRNDLNFWTRFRIVLSDSVSPRRTLRVRLEPISRLQPVAINGTDPSISTHTFW